MKNIFFIFLSIFFLNACTHYNMGSAGPNSYYKVELMVSGQTEDLAKICPNGTGQVELGGNAFQKVLVPFGTLASFGLVRIKVVEQQCHYTQPVKTDKIVEEKVVVPNTSDSIEISAN